MFELEGVLRWDKHGPVGIKLSRERYGPIRDGKKDDPRRTTGPVGRRAEGRRRTEVGLGGEMVDSATVSFESLQGLKMSKVTDWTRCVG